MRRLVLVFVFALGLVSGALPLDAAPATSLPGPDTATLFVETRNGLATGSAAPGSPVTVRVVQGSSVVTSAQVVADAAGRWMAPVSNHNGRTPGVHEGQVVEVTTTTGLHRQTVKLAGLLDEATGVLTGVALPKAKISAEVFTNGDRARRLGLLNATADSNGRFRLDLRRAFGSGAGGTAPYRGWLADLRASDVTGQVLRRELQSPNATLVQTNGHAGASHLLPGGTVRFSLRRAGAEVATATGVVDGDGVAQAKFAAPVLAGDVMRTAYPTADASRLGVLDLAPFALTAVADAGADRVSGTAAAGAAVVTVYDDGTGNRLHKTVAGSDGRWSVAVPNLTGDRLLVVWRVADPTLTGVGVHQIEMRSPVIRLADATGDVTGYGAHGAGPATATLSRSGVDVATASGVRTAEGKFSLKLGVPALPGDVVVVRTDDLVLPTFTTPVVPTATVAGSSVAGTAAPGHAVRVAASPTCAATGTAADDGSWSLVLPCPVGSLLEVRTVTTTGPSEGSFAVRLIGV